MSFTMDSTSGNMALACSGVKNFLRFFGSAIMAATHLASGGGGAGSVVAGFSAGAAGAAAAGFSAGAAVAAAGFSAGFSAGLGGSGFFSHTGPTCNLLAAMAVGFSDAWPQAASSGNAAKSTMQPSRL